MAYRANPFLERMSERTASDNDFARLFSPKILDKLAEDALEGGVHLFRSAPGAGKTTLLRAFTPAALRAFWNAGRRPELTESFQRLVGRGVLDEQEGPQFLGVLLSCGSGYADLPAGAHISRDGLFRALFDCRIVLRTLRSVGALLGHEPTDQLKGIQLEYDTTAADLRGIPLVGDAAELAAWAERQEQDVYSQLDSFAGIGVVEAPAHVRFEGVLWLQSVRFLLNGNTVAPRRLLMIDDLHKLRRSQRELLIDELTVLRPTIPVWLASRSSAFTDDFLSQGARQGRDLRQYTLEELWSGPKGLHQFVGFAQNILDRRMTMQDVVASGSFAQCLRGDLYPDEVLAQVTRGVELFRQDVRRHRTKARYSEWLEHAERRAAESSIESLLDLYVTRILLARDEARRQMSLDLALPAEELEDRDSSQVRGAAEIFTNEELKVPYYFGLERICTMATSNVEELLSLAAALYVGLQSKQILRRPDLVLTPAEQEKILRESARQKRDFIPKGHTEGARAQRLLDSIGVFCREKTFSPSAPYAPGVTGIRLSQGELNRLLSGSRPLGDHGVVLARVVSECAADNLLVAKPSAASTSRESGTIFYLNRTLCAFYGLPLQMGGWNDVLCRDLIDWMELGLSPSRSQRLGVA